MYIRIYIHTTYIHTYIHTYALALGGRGVAAGVPGPHLEHRLGVHDDGRVVRGRWSGRHRVT
jgi:hypothetical protein